MELSKARLSALVVMSTTAGYLMSGSGVDLATMAAAAAGTSLAAFSANTWNQVWEVRNDSLMKRTMRRPLPSGRLTTRQAVAWGAGTAVASTAVLAVGCNPLTAALGVGNIALYSLVYTPLKTRSELNTWVGSVVGAIPPVMGWAAATGSVLSPEAAAMGALLYLWQFPHFFALSWRSRRDYAAGGYRMVSVADEAGHRTAGLVRRYSLYMAALPLAASFCGVTSAMYAVEGVAVNAYALYLAQRFHQKPNNANAQRVFLASLWYLPLMMFLMVFHSRNWDDNKAKAPLAQAAADAAALDAHRCSSAAKPVDRAVAAARGELSGLCPHEVLKLPSCDSCPVGDRVAEHTDTVHRGAHVLRDGVLGGAGSVAAGDAAETSHHDGQ